MNVSAQEIVTFLIAVGGFLGTLLLLILNLKVSAAINSLRVTVTFDMKNVEIQMAHMRTEAAQDRANLYERIMENMTRTFVNRDASDAMHKANIQRLDSLEENLRMLSERVA